MTDPLLLAGAAVAGAALGTVFYGGLWWTLRSGLARRNPAPWLLASSLLRMGFALAGFYVIGASDWQRLLSCLAGFIGVRLLLIRLAKPPLAAGPRPSQEAGRAS